MVKRNIRIKWKYNIGDNIIDENRNLTITNRYTTEYAYFKNGKEYVSNIKHYMYTCNICGFNEGDVFEGNLCNKKSGCPCCNGRVVVRGINDIATKRPDLVEYFININDAYTHTIYSADKVWVKCPICGFEKQIIVYNLVKSGLGCNKCSDGISYPEKFVMSMLNQLHVEYATQYMIEGYKYKYDFYIKSYNAIVETHGEQHYTNAFKGVSLEDVKKNDSMKEDVALQNSIDYYIKLNCSESSLEYIKKSIYDDDFLRNNFNLSEVDWDLCHKEALRNKLIDVCNYWKNNCETIDVNDVMDKFSISRNTVLSYLHTGTDIGLCYYSKEIEYKKAGKKRVGKNNPMYGKKLSKQRKNELLKYSIENGKKKAKKVCQLSYTSAELIEIHPSLNSLKKKYGYSTYSISQCCKGERKSAYGYKWEFYTDYLDKLEAQKNGMDLFGGVGEGSKNDVVTSQDICNNNNDEVDLSWLDDIA